MWRQIPFDLDSVLACSRRAAVAAVALGTILVLALGSAARAAEQESERLRRQAEEKARVARANRLAALSRSVMEDTPQLALLLAAEAALTDSIERYGRILVWQTKDFGGTPASVCRGTMDFTLGSLSFSRDGAWLVSSSSQEVTVWPWEKSGPGYVFPYPHAIVQKAEISGDGRWLIVSHQGGVEAWSLDFRALAASARDRAGRDFTGRERERYLSP